MFICKYFKAKTFFTFLCFKMITWCFSLFFFFFGQFLDLSFCSVTTSGITLHLTFCEQLTHTVWCCTKALCIIFVLLFSRLPLLSSEFLYRLRSCLTHSSCSTAMDLVSLLSKQKPERTMILKPSGLLPTRPGFIVTDAIKSLYRENAQAHSWWLIMT